MVKPTPAVEKREGAAAGLSGAAATWYPGSQRQMAALLILLSIFEADFLEISYGFRLGKSAHQALERIKQNLREGHAVIYHADLESYFDTIPNDILMKTVEMRVADRSVMYVCWSDRVSMRSWLLLQWAGKIAETSKRPVVCSSLVIARLLVKLAAWDVVSLIAQVISRKDIQAVSWT